MGYQIIRQPGDEELFGIFSTYTDSIIVWDASRDEVVDWFVEAEVKRVRRDISATLDKVAAGNARRAYFQFAMTWDEAVKTDRERGGEAWKSFTPLPHDGGET